MAFSLELKTLRTLKTTFRKCVKYMKICFNRKDILNFNAL